MMSMKILSRCFSIISIACIRGYQVVNPYFIRILITTTGMSFDCRYDESCSHYMIRVIQTHGTIAGIARGTKRILHCIGKQ